MAPTVPTHDYYVVLQVQPDVLHDEIKASYRRLARLHHPDKNIGCKEATAKTQLINAAWEVLGDVEKRQQYDRTRLKPTASTSSSPNPPKPSPTASSQQSYRSPPPQPDTTAQDEARAQAASNAKRQEWLNFEKHQEQQIRHCLKVVKPLEAELAALDAKIKENKAKLANDVPYAWNVFAYFKKKLSEKEKNELRKECIDAENATRIKQIPLNRTRAQLQQLRDELVCRKYLEDIRLANEHIEADRKERVRKAKVEEARLKEQARQQAQQRAEQEVREAAARKEAERLRQEQEREMAEYLARVRAANRAAERMRQEQAKKQQAEQDAFYKTFAEKVREQKEAKNAEQQQKSKVRPKNGAKASGSCKHKGWWDTVEGRRECGYCTATLYKFAQRCPGCGIMSCDACRRVLQAGGTPSVDHSRRNGNGRTGKKAGRYTTGLGYEGYEEEEHYHF
ncbi:Chaperone protein DnaJ [Pyrenophora tritici-repentis]|nr:Chaperone protein DnaJ [Pyrenophora tritici-repentis]